jgi:peptidoglycan-associated lipoprotein
MRLSALRFIMIATVASVAIAGCAKKQPVGSDSNTAARDLGGFGPGGQAGGAPGGFGNGAGGGAGAGGQFVRDAAGNLFDANGNRVDAFGNPIQSAPLGTLPGQGGIAGGPGGGIAGGAPQTVYAGPGSAGTVQQGGGVYQSGGVIDGGAYQPGGNGVFLDGNGNFVDANGNPVDANGNPIAGAAYQQGGTFVQGGPYDAGGGSFVQGGPYAPGGTFASGPGAASYNFAGDDGSPNYFAQRVGDRVLFATDSSTIDPQGQEILRRQAAWFNLHPEYAITVEGHADERGTRDYNLALGARRANAVRGYLSSLGIDPNRVRTVSYGKERPVNPASTPNGWAVNRRAVSTLRGGSGASF